MKEGLRLFLKQFGIIFVHVPKTGGNFLQTRFVRVWGADPEILERPGGFELRDAATDRKHQSLREYQKKFGVEIEELDVVAVWRDPVDRLLSWYFSPHRHRMRKFLNRVWFSPRKFEDSVSRLTSVTSMLELSNGPMPKSLRLINFGNLESEIRELEVNLGLPNAPFDNPINQSVSPGLKRRLRGSARVREVVRRSQHSRDWELTPGLDGESRKLLWRAEV